MAFPFSIGEVVKLNSGSPDLTVTSVNMDGVGVSWITDDGVTSFARFPFPCVKRKEDSK